LGHPALGAGGGQPLGIRVGAKLPEAAEVIEAQPVDDPAALPAGAQRDQLEPGLPVVFLLPLDMMGPLLERAVGAEPVPAPVGNGARQWRSQGRLSGRS
jgi:hypothetical protein